MRSTRLTAIASLGVLLLPALLLAHTVLRRSLPAANARVAMAPDTARLWFTERPELAVTTLRLVRGTDTVALAPLAFLADSSVGAALPPLEAGRYLLLWRTTGADGHPRVGRIPFTVTAGIPAGIAAAATAPPVAAADTAVDPLPADPASASHDHAAAGEPAAPNPALAWPYVLVRWLAWVGLFLAIGGWSARTVVVRRAAEATREHAALAPELVLVLRERARRAAMIGALLLLAATVARLFLQASALALDTPGPLLATAWGRGWVAQLVGAALLVPFTRRADWGEGPRGWLLAALPLLLVTVGLAGTGHAAATGHGAMLWILADALHLAAAGAWIGTLFVLAAAVASRLDGVRFGLLFARFSRVALVGGILAVSAGMLLAIHHLGGLDALFGTPYGRFLVRKAVLVALVLALGLLNWQVIVPRLARGEGRAWSVHLEAIGAVVVLALTAILVALPAPMEE